MYTIPMKIVIATDSFKGSFSSVEAGRAMERGILAVFPRARCVLVPVADGGEGTVDALVQGLDGERHSVVCRDPLGRGVRADFGLIGENAVMEMAAASGLTLLAEGERDPGVTSTFGTGELIRAILDLGCRNITIGIGGSATNDGGAGMATALGFRFLDERGDVLEQGGVALENLVSIDDSGVDARLAETVVRVACDVDNPLLGPEGASAVYGPQKGADSEGVRVLDSSLAHFADVVEGWKGRVLRDVPGAGAAGGLGFGLMAFCNASMRSGIDLVLDLTGFDSLVRGADFVVTGEGRIDGQSLRGKVPVGVAARASEAGVPVLAVVGCVGDDWERVYSCGIDAVVSSVDSPMTGEEALGRSDSAISGAAERAFRLIRLGGGGQK